MFWGRMSRTRKDSRQGTVIELVKRSDGAFDLFLNRELDREGIHEDGLMDVLCVRFGYCGEEYDSTLHEVNQNGRAKMIP
jgi:hypothetical protein